MFLGQLGLIRCNPWIPVFKLETVNDGQRGIKLDRVNENVNLSKLQKASFLTKLI